MRARHASLWRHGDFLKLLCGETVSLVGSQVTTLALPLAAALSVHASVFQIGLLNAAGIVPGLLLGPVAGVWADRRRRRPILIAVALGRAAVLGSIPVAAALGALTLAQLYMVAVLGGAIGTGSGAWRPYLSTLVGPEQLVESNSMLEVSRAVAQISGPGLGGVLVQALSAPMAIGIDALSFLVPALSLAAIHAQEPAPARPARARHMGHELADGLRATLGNPYLRAVAGTTGSAIFFQSIVSSVYVYYMAKDLALAPAVQGVLFAAGGIGSLAGAFIAAPVTRRFGVGPAIVGAELGLDSRRC